MQHCLANVAMMQALSVYFTILSICIETLVSGNHVEHSPAWQSLPAVGSPSSILLNAAVRTTAGQSCELCLPPFCHHQQTPHSLLMLLLLHNVLRLSDKINWLSKPASPLKLESSHSCCSGQYEMFYTPVISHYLVTPTAHCNTTCLIASGLQYREPIAHTDIHTYRNTFTMSNKHTCGL